MSRFGLPVVTLIVGILGIVAWVAWASVDRPTCADWDEWWFHHRATVGHIRWCIQNNRVDINQQDEDGRTLLHRIAADFPKERKSVRDRDSQVSYEGRTRTQRLAATKEILRWKDARNLNLEIRDHEGRTVFNEAMRRGKGHPMAALLVQAGAQITLSTRNEERLTEETMPLVQAFGERLKNPFEEDVDFDQLLACRSLDCLLNETLTD